MKWGALLVSRKIPRGSESEKRQVRGKQAASANSLSSILMIGVVIKPGILFLGIAAQLLGASCLAANSYPLDTKIRQLEIDRRTDQVRRDMKTESDAMLSSQLAASHRFFSPSLANYHAPLRSTITISPEQLEQYIEGLGNLQDQSGIYAYPPVERLYHYGRLCLDVGLVNEGIRAISEHTRIQAALEVEATTDGQ